jgi:hypothetical protein
LDISYNRVDNREQLPTIALGTKLLIVPVTHQGEVVLRQNKRPMVNPSPFELLTGTVNMGESIERSAMRIVSEKLDLHVLIAPATSRGIQLVVHGYYLLEERLHVVWQLLTLDSNALLRIPYDPHYGKVAVHPSNLAVLADVRVLELHKTIIETVMATNG